jgi:hypothetical protein
MFRIQFRSFRPVSLPIHREQFRNISRFSVRSNVVIRNRNLTWKKNTDEHAPNFIWPSFDERFWKNEGAVEENALCGGSRLEECTAAK